MHREPIKFESLIDHTKSQKEYSQLFVQYDARDQSLAMIVRLIEEHGGHIAAIEIADSDEADHKIACFRLHDRTIQNIVIA